MRGQRLDPTLPSHRDEIVAAFGAAAAWQMAVDNLKLREARVTDPRKKRALRLALYNAENQLRLATTTQGANEMTDQELIRAVRDYALDNYNDDGWDYLVECWEDDYILECIGTAKTTKQAINNVRDALRPLADMRDEVRAAGEW